MFDNDETRRPSISRSDVTNRGLQDCGCPKIRALAHLTVPASVVPDVTNSQVTHVLTRFPSHFPRDKTVKMGDRRKPWASNVKGDFKDVTFGSTEDGMFFSAKHADTGRQRVISADSDDIAAGRYRERESGPVPDDRGRVRDYDPRYRDNYGNYAPSPYELSNAPRRYSPPNAPTPQRAQSPPAYGGSRWGAAQTQDQGRQEQRGWGYPAVAPGNQDINNNHARTAEPCVVTMTTRRGVSTGMVDNNGTLYTMDRSGRVVTQPAARETVDFANQLADARNYDHTWDAFDHIRDNQNQYPPRGQSTPNLDLPRTVGMLPAPIASPPPLVNNTINNNGIYEMAGCQPKRAPIIQEPVMHDTIINKPVMNDTMMKNTTINKPVMKDTMMKNTTINKPTMNETMMKNTTINKPVMKDTMMKNTTINKPTMNETMMKNTTMKKPVMKETYMKNTVMKKPQIYKPIMNNPVLHNPEIKNPVMNNPTIIYGDDKGKAKGKSKVQFESTSSSSSSEDEDHHKRSHRRRKSSPKIFYTEYMRERQREHHSHGRSEKHSDKQTDKHSEKQSSKHASKHASKYSSKTADKHSDKKKKKKGKACKSTFFDSSDGSCCGGSSCCSLYCVHLLTLYFRSNVLNPVLYLTPRGERLDLNMKRYIPPPSPEQEYLPVHSPPLT
ncbi:hypothetical protein TWF718_009333 [Orbilia javanica]|uniref:Uncharacterized protein n=1 Tax=Orbilia javanica TaxID=47235 RepID=A0AAN8MM08_9PEZI